MITKLQKKRAKNSPCEQGASGGPNDTHPGATVENAEEEIIYKPPFVGRMRGGDKWITLPDNESMYSVGARVMSCALLYEHFGWAP